MRSTADQLTEILSIIPHGYRNPIIAPQMVSATTPTAAISVRTRNRNVRIGTPPDETRLTPNPH